MDRSQIELPGCEIESILGGGGTLRVQFSRAYILTSMTGSKERTRWWQAGFLVIEGISDQPSLPRGPLICAGGDIDENVYTYRDTLPVPFASRGLIRCCLRFEGEEKPLSVTGRAVRLEMTGVPKYIEHLPA